MTTANICQVLANYLLSSLPAHLVSIAYTSFLLFIQFFRAGTGKSTTAELLVAQSPVPLRHISVGDLVKERHLHEGYDKEWESYLVDDDKASYLSLEFMYSSLINRFWMSWSLWSKMAA